MSGKQLSTAGANLIKFLTFHFFLFLTHFFFNVDFNRVSLIFFFFISLESRVLVYCLEFHSVYLSPFIFSPTIMKKRTKHRAGTELIITDIILFVTFVFRHRVIQLDWNTIEECTYENDRHVVRCFVLFDERKKKKRRRKNTRQ